MVASQVFDMGPLLLRLSEFGQQTETTVILCHHFRKNGERYAMPELEELSQAGFAEWARQWLLISRHSKYEEDGKHPLWIAAGGSDGHSGGYGVDIDEGVLQSDFTGRYWDVTVRHAHEVRKEEEKDTEQRWQIKNALRGRDGESLTWLKEHAHMGLPTVRKQIDVMLEDMTVEQFTGQCGKNSKAELYRLTKHA
ncbi:MAG: hypothetical protein CMJ64_20275 [Planctomycetaceae bacterium]|nr:hypothetical protein [Planctomycetaceae bacterium]